MYFFSTDTIFFQNTFNLPWVERVDMETLGTG